MTQTENNLAELCQAQSEALEKCQREITAERHVGRSEANELRERLRLAALENTRLRDERNYAYLMGREKLEKCQWGRDKALLALRAVIGVIEMSTFEGQSVYRPDCAAREMEILTIAKAALKEARHEAVSQTGTAQGEEATRL